MALLSPFAPHLCEEIWERLRMPVALEEFGWPRPDPRRHRHGGSPIVVKVDAEPVVRLEVPAEAGREEVLEAALKHEAVKRHLGGRGVGKAIYVPGQILNIVTT
jgi:leucyl-tRNA synthetase